MARVSGVILAGGEGVRLGGYKPTVLLGGQPLILYAVQALLGLVEELRVAYGQEVHRAELEALPLDATLLPDPGEGPLGALLRAFEQVPHDWIVVTPCDMPLVSPALYETLLTAARTADGAVSRIGGVANPILGAYGRRAFLDAAEEVAARGSRSPRDVLPRLQMAYVEEDVLLGMPYGLDCLLDIDTPADFERAERLLRAA